MKRAIELLKTVLIVLLSCTLILLAIMAMPTDAIRSNPVLSWMLQPIAPLLGLPEAELTYVESAPTLLDSAQPVAISIRNAAGRTTIQWEFDTLDSTFESLGSALGQALDTAEAFTEATEAQICQALSQTSVAFRYAGALPAELLAAWLGAELEVDAAAETCILAVEDNSVVLYLVQDSSIRAVTHLDPATLEELLDDYRPDGSAFGFETQLNVADLSLVPGQTPTINGGQSSNPCTPRFLNDLATSLGFNPYGDGRYTDDQGTTHFSETNLSLQISSDGLVQLTSSAPDWYRASDSSVEALAETARKLTQQVLAQISDDSRLYLTGVTRTEEETAFQFTYLVSGIPVSLASSAATVTFQGQSVTGLTMSVRRFTVTDQLCYPLPVAQAAAILPQGGSLQLQYRITADGLLDAGWKK